MIILYRTGQSLYMASFIGCCRAELLSHSETGAVMPEQEDESQQVEPVGGTAKFVLN